MNWQLFGLTFLTVFLAEIGDKSQLAAIALSGASSSPRAVILGSVSALILTSLLGVIIGASMSQFLPERLLKAMVAIGMMLIALKLLWVSSGDELS
jgi:putative Ca2+/H+ antiporter (TMEM165/GDT1 family)